MAGKDDFLEHMMPVAEALQEQQKEETTNDSLQAHGIPLEQGICTNHSPPAAAAHKPRLSPDLVGFLLAMKREVPTIDHLDELTDVFPPEWIEKRRQEHKNRVELYNKIDDDIELYQDKIRKELSEHGYIQAKQVSEELLASFTRLEARGKEKFAKSKKIEFNDSDFED